MLSHAYIFHGSDEVSKRETAFWFANKLLSNDKNFHPDLFLLKPDNQNGITIDLIRQLKKFLILRPYSADYKIAIIENGENLNDFAQNALLKIFEEAPDYALTIICVKSPDSILDTITSRGVKLPFWRIKKDSPSIDKKTLETFNQMFNANFPNKYLCLENLAYKPTEFFRLWINFLREKLLSGPTKELNNLIKINQNIYFKLNETNINPKFAYDELILSLL
ncbi:MAG: polymerase III, delta-prime subunit protein [Candidatus Azambacteria bacterium GW2011_GWA2_42_9]|nr:MAG: polymerase III, delta-prime subunit protein [Candidatus Azambacteria bacterium GW2011_GWB1_42_17]KKS46579.1 MAG: polymerase III, delta-prime subunit protein [Candidatus Azambacteria bacterium GW2011_GWA1_42_19]KKS75546.1 MAG: polymerase III, delta-prime subunit protein [Candidatus Azambacteria bacterium GW2011_GWA2_42_9]KKS88885.1 MAG: polymerase III, delta-prime subunit protein [Parcubacteria group bacterium GW2011_GWC1_43_11]